MTRLHAELMRSISHYRSQQQGTRAASAFFSAAASASMPYMREFFHEKLQLPIEFFNPLRNVAVAEASNVEEVAHSAHLLGELVGLALRTTMTCPMELNLRPASVVRRQELASGGRFLFLAAACFVLGLARLGILLHARGARSKQRESDNAAGRSRAHARPGNADRASAQANRRARQRADAAGRGDERPQLLAADIEDLNARLPKENIWITELAPISGGQPVDGRKRERPAGSDAATDCPLVDGARTRAQQRRSRAGDRRNFRSRLYLFEPEATGSGGRLFPESARLKIFEIDPNNQSKVIKPTTPKNTEWAYPYELRLEAEQPAQPAMNWFRQNKIPRRVS